MKKFKGTKGSWYHNFNGEYWEVRRKEDFEDSKSLSVSVFVFDTKTEQVEMIIKEAEANARLIASAPELAKALQEAIELFESAYTCMENGDNEGLYNALANATSRSNFKEVLTKAIGE